MAVITLHDALDLTNVSNGGFFGRVASASDFYAWAPAAVSTVTMTALSGLDDITVDAAGLPLTGTVAALFQSTVGGGLIYSVLDLNAPLTALIDTTSSASNEKYWERILIGGTLFTNDVSAAFELSGDFLNIAAGETRSGGDDAFELVTSESFELIGDSFDVKVGGTLTGGADRFIVRATFGIIPTIAGDVNTHSGTVNGGADVIDFTGNIADGSRICGDVLTSNGLLNGGADRITINAQGDFAADTIMVAGDAIDAIRQVNGGNDTIILKLAQDNPLGFIMQMAGDVHTVASGDALVDGGNDVITVTGIRTDVLAGDVAFMSAGTLNAGDDTITFNGTSNVTIVGDIHSFTGGTLNPGADNIKGGSGNDTIFGESSTPGFPTTIGTTVESGGSDVIDGRDGNDIILGQVGADIITGGRGNDLLNGGSGNDTVSFATLALPVYVDLAGIAGSVTAGGGLAEAIGQGIDDILNCENVTGSSGRDTIKGNASGNVLAGGDNADVLNGRAGNDTLVGGKGADRLVGGIGNDTFRFASVIETGTSASTADEIVGFASGDRIDLSGIDANPANATEAFTFVGSLSGAAQVAVSQSGGNTIVSASTDGDAAAEFIIVLRGLVTLTAADFIL